MIFSLQISVKFNPSAWCARKYLGSSAGHIFMEISQISKGDPMFKSDNKSDAKNYRPISIIFLLQGYLKKLYMISCIIY